MGFGYRQKRVFGKSGRQNANGSYHTSSTGSTRRESNERTCGKGTHFQRVTSAEEEHVGTGRRGGGSSEPKYSCRIVLDYEARHSLARKHGVFAGTF